MGFLSQQRLKVGRKMPAWGKKGGERLLRKWYKMQERNEQMKVVKSISGKNWDSVWVVLADHGVAH